MARKKKVEPPVIPNEYGIVWNGEFLQSVFVPHKKTKTKKLVRSSSASITMAIMARWIKGSKSAYIQELYTVYQNGIQPLTFSSPLAAKIWLVSHSSFPSGKANCFFFTEAELDRIINKHKYVFKYYELTEDNQKPLLCEFHIQKLNGEHAYVDI
jgi:hypothetical protein